MNAWEGAEDVNELPDYSDSKKKRKNIDWDSFVVPGERGKHIDEYMKEMRGNDRQLRQYKELSCLTVNDLE